METTTSSKGYKFYIALFIIFVAAVSSLIYFYYRTQVSLISTVPKPTELTEDQKRFLIDLQSKIKIPLILSSQSEKVLPKDLAFIIPESKNVVIRSTKFSNSKTGYLVYYDAGYNIVGSIRSQGLVFSATKEKSKWKLLMGSSIDSYALLEEESDKYQVKMQFFDKSNSLTQVVMSIIQK